MTNQLNFESTFGMFEMEKAVPVILKKQEGRVEGEYSPMYLEDFTTDEEKVGFLELIYGGFLGKQSLDLDSRYNTYTYNGGFVPNKSFFNRIQNRTGARRERCDVNVRLRKASEEDETLSGVVS